MRSARTSSGSRASASMASRVPPSTSLRIGIEVAGSGRSHVETGLPVLDELLGVLARAARFDLTLESSAGGGDAAVEAVGRALGEALVDVLERPGARRIADATAPADEALANVTLEVSGPSAARSERRPRGCPARRPAGGSPAPSARGAHRGCRSDAPRRLLHGEETSHVVYAIVKALGLALGQAATP